MLVIDPEECIDCTLCVPECPIDAIVAEDELEPDQQHWFDLNAELSQQWPIIAEKKNAPSDASDWDTVKDKLQYLER